MGGFLTGTGQTNNGLEMPSETPSNHVPGVKPTDSPALSEGGEGLTESSEANYLRAEARRILEEARQAREERLAAAAKKVE